MDKILQKKKKNTPYLIGIITILLLSFWFYYSFSMKETLNVESNRLDIYTVKKDNFNEYITIQGNVLPFKTYYLDLVEGGSVEELFVEDGAILKKGDPILKLENTNLMMDIMYREAELYEQSNNLRNTRLSMEQNTLNLKNQILDSKYKLMELKRIFNRNKDLFAKEFISNEEFQKSKENYKYNQEKLNLSIESMKIDSAFRKEQISQLESSIKRMKENLDFVKTKLEKLIVRSPVDGQLTSLNAEIGESKTAGARVGVVDDVSRYKIQASIDEYYLQRVSLGTNASIESNGQIFNARLMKIYPQINNGTFNIDLEILDNIQNLRRGQTFNITIDLGGKSKSLVLKRGPFFNQSGGNWCYILEGKRKAVKREITLGRRNSDYYEIVDGLNEGEKVIISSYLNYNDAEILKN